MVQWQTDYLPLGIWLSITGRTRGTWQPCPLTVKCICLSGRVRNQCMNFWSTHLRIVMHFARRDRFIKLRWVKIVLNVFLWVFYSFALVLNKHIWKHTVLLSMHLPTSPQARDFALFIPPAQFGTFPPLTQLPHSASLKDRFVFFPHVF